jgi:hypothetical protein
MNLRTGSTIQRSAERSQAAYVKFIALHKEHCLCIFVRVIRGIWRKSLDSAYHSITSSTGKKYLRKKTHKRAFLLNSQHELK